MAIEDLYKQLDGMQKLVELERKQERRFAALGLFAGFVVGFVCLRLSIR